jgi:hypothetical protein
MKMITAKDHSVLLVLFAISCSPSATCAMGQIGYRVGFPRFSIRQLLSFGDDAGPPDFSSHEIFLSRVT